MDAVEGLRSKALYRIFIAVVKVIPIACSAIYVANTALSYFSIDVPAFSYIGGCSVLTILFMYLSSYVFRFCAWHRMFIHYIAVNWILNIVDYHIGIPVSDKGLFIMYVAITGMFMFLTLYLKFRK